MFKFINKIAKIGTIILPIPSTFFMIVSCSHNILYSDLQKIVPYMHMATFRDYADDPKHETVHVTNSSSDTFGCSAIRNGDLFGRNFDYYYTNVPSFLVKVEANKSKNRYSSIGICFNSNVVEDDIINAEKRHISNLHSLEIAPNKTVDGINENGVACCMNVCSLDDTEPITGTHPGCPRLYANFVCRFVLDHATSAKNAVDLLAEQDIYLDDNDANNVHFMIADQKETYIVELFGNHLRSLPKTNKDRIMTNFYNNLSKEEIKGTYAEQIPEEFMKYPEHAKGVERYEKLVENYDGASSISTMCNVLEEIKYTNMYPDHGGVIPTIPDAPSEDFTQTEIYHEQYEGYKDIYTETRYILENQRRDLGREKDVWITVHSSIYDIAQKKLNLVVQENYSHSYEISLDDFRIR